MHTLVRPPLPLSQCSLMERDKATLSPNQRSDFYGKGNTRAQGPALSQALAFRDPLPTDCPALHQTERPTISYSSNWHSRYTLVYCRNAGKVDDGQRLPRFRRKKGEVGHEAEKVGAKELKMQVSEPVLVFS